MGAAVAIDIAKPKDASDIRATGSLSIAKEEVIRLRGLLGHLAKDYGINAVVYDASDLVLGKDDDEDFERCVKDIAHIRGCLHLQSQTSIRSSRSERKYSRPVLQPEDMESDDHDSSSSEDDRKSHRSRK